MSDVANDIELWDRVRIKNDQRAFAAIYRLHSRKLYAMVHNRLKDKQLAEDIVQEAFVSLWKNREHTGITSLEGYLAVSVRFLILKQFRKERTDKLQLSDKALPEVPEQLDPAHFYDARQLAELLEEETARLPHQCRLVFLYSREEGYKIPEIAKIMDLSPKTVEAHLSLALKKLKKAFHIIPLLHTLVTIINFL